MLKFVFDRTLGPAKPKSAQAPLYGFSPPHFAVAGLAAQGLIRNRKTSVT